MNNDKSYKHGSPLYIDSIMLDNLASLTVLNDAMTVLNDAMTFGRGVA